MFASINFRTKRGSLAVKVVRNSEESGILLSDILFGVLHSLLGF